MNMLIELAQKTPDQLLAQTQSSAQGLSTLQVEQNRLRFGDNQLHIKEQSIIVEFLSHFTSPMILILIIASAISAYFGELTQFIIISIMIFISGVIDFLQERHAKSIAKALANQVQLTSSVLRDSIKQEIRSKDVVVGDVVFFSAGDAICADCIVLESHDFLVNQSSITGESFPQEKKPGTTTAKTLSELTNVVFSGTSVVCGYAKCLVVQVGTHTELGLSVAVSTTQVKSEYDVGIQKFGYFILKTAVFLVLFVFLFNSIAKNSVIESFMFAIAIAVGLVPELLPMIMTITMAQGAKDMSKKGAIVKRLHAIPNFGSMTVLCTDKTGTLTENQVQLDSVYSVSRKSHPYILEQAFLNSHFQSGLKNPIDTALLSYQAYSANGYEKIDEIPYEFVRKRLSVVLTPKCVDQSTAKHVARLASNSQTHHILICKGAPEQILDRCTSCIDFSITHSKHASSQSVKSSQSAKLSESATTSSKKVATLAPYAPYIHTTPVSETRVPRVVPLKKTIAKKIVSALASIRNKAGGIGVHHSSLTGVSCKSADTRALHAVYSQLSAQGFRVIALAQKVIPASQTKKVYSSADEQDLTFIGFLTFIDPPKADVSATISQLVQSGVQVKIITGDSELVTQHICQTLQLPVQGILTGAQIDQLSDSALSVSAQQTTVFARCSPIQKSRIIIALKSAGHVVGYMGDGINDAPALKHADVGISVNTAVDVAKDAADIILTQKDLQILHTAIVDGRKTFANSLKYILMVLSSNFGNMISMVGAVAFLPFLPMLPIQIILNNLLYDISQMTIPFDAVDAELVDKPRRWNPEFMKKFMWTFGSISSVFDFVTFGLMLALGFLGSQFQTGWFMASIATQVFVIYAIRTKNAMSLPSIPVICSTIGIVIIAWLIPYTPLGAFFGFTPPPVWFMAILLCITTVYVLTVQSLKRFFYMKVSFDK
jgi:magnesium-transporting ATPase (P-type)